MHNTFISVNNLYSSVTLTKENWIPVYSEQLKVSQNIKYQTKQNLPNKTEERKHEYIARP